MKDNVLKFVERMNRQAIEDALVNLGHDYPTRAQDCIKHLWLIRRGETLEVSRRYLRNAADVCKPQAPVYCGICDIDTMKKTLLRARAMGDTKKEVELTKMIEGGGQR